MQFLDHASSDEFSPLDVAVVDQKGLEVLLRGDYKRGSPQLFGNVLRKVLGRDQIELGAQIHLIAGVLRQTSVLEEGVGHGAKDCDGLQFPSIDLTFDGRA